MMVMVMMGCDGNGDDGDCDNGGSKVNCGDDEV